jgi:hypothetical protein
LRVHRFAAGDETIGVPHSCSLEAFFGCQFLFQNVGWILDFPATGAGRIAAEERFDTAKG